MAGKTSHYTGCNRSKFIVAAVILIALFCGQAWAVRITEGTKGYLLDNGLDVILKEDHSSSVAAVQVWVKTGSANETESEAGITHLIEHMIFKGTPRRKTGEIARTIESAGGNINAYTTFDRTVYFAEIAGDEVETALDVLLDAVQNSLFDPVELEREKEVVLEEYRRSLDLPERRFSKEMMKLSFDNHPYGRPVIGYESTISSFKRDDIINYVDKWYTPQNMVLVAVGDFDSGRVLNLIRSFTKDFPPRHGAERETRTLTPQASIRSMVLKADVQQVSMDISFHIPTVTDPDIPALDILDTILGSGRSSRLYTQLRMKKNLVRGVGTGSYSMIDGGLFSIRCMLDEKNIADVLKTIAEEVSGIINEPVSDSELGKAKQIAEVNYISQMEEMDGQAKTIGYFEVMAGDFNEIDRYLEQLRSVTASDVIRVARKYLKPEGFSIGFMVPEASGFSISEDKIRDIFSDAAKIYTPDIIGKENIETPASISRLPNDIRIIVKENHHLPLVSVKAVFMGGVRLEAPEKAGISSFISRMLTRGTSKKSAYDIAQSVESMAGNLDGFSGRNSFGLSGEFLSKDMNAFLDLMAEIILDPSFPDSEAEKVRTDMLADIMRKKDNPTSQLYDLFFSTLYKNHPYDRPSSGDAESISSITRDDLIGFYRRLALPENLVISIVGDVERNEVLGRIGGLFKSMKKGVFKPPFIKPEPVPDKIRSVHLERPGNQIHIMMGYLGADLKSPDNAVMTLVDSVMSGQGGRLFRELRDKESLAYSVSSFRMPGLETGMFGAYIACEPDKLARAKHALLEEMEKLKKDGLTKKELDDAKRYVIGNEAIGYQTNSSQALGMALDELYGLGYDNRSKFLDAIKNVNADDVLRAVKKYINPDGYVIATLGPAPDTHGEK